MTAIPYADARFVDDLNPNTRPSVASISSQLISGTYTCPFSCADVWRMSNRGAYPSCTACCVSENAPEMIACEAMTVAIVATTTSGYSAHDGARW